MNVHAAEVNDLTIYCITGPDECGWSYTSTTDEDEAWDMHRAHCYDKHDDKEGPMDPDKTLFLYQMAGVRAANAERDGSIEEVAEAYADAYNHAYSLFEWLANGGFAPNYRAAIHGEE